MERMTEGDAYSGRVLIVEDHLPTSRLITTAFQEVASGVTCVEVNTAEQAVEFLTRTGTPSDKPEIVLLDLDLPNDGGYSVLQTLKNDPELRRKPVVVLSADSRQETIDRAYELNASTFVSKPDEWAEFLKMADTIARYWFDTADCPATTSFAPTDRENPPVEIE